MQIETLPSGTDISSHEIGRLMSVTRSAPQLTIKGFLGAAKGHARFYWESQRDEIALAGFGAAVELGAWGADRFAMIERRARQLFENALIRTPDSRRALPRLFGGFAFTDDFVPDNTWSVYTPAYFVLPHFQLTRYRQQTWLTLNATVALDEDIERALHELRDALDARYQDLIEAPALEFVQADHGAPVEVNFPMPFEIWDEKIRKATAEISEGELLKVVLARACELRFARRVNVDSALGYLAEHYAECYRFLFEPQPYHAFYGATPELLVGVQGSRLSTMGLAGSIRRGASSEEDARLAAQLMADPKERLEHHLVVEAMREKLAQFTDELHIPVEPAVYRLSNIQHLYTPIHGQLNAPYGVLPLVAALHPTPALGGAPRDRAMAFIQDAEPVPRGWYAAPVGWIDSQLDGQFGVAIRSAVSEERRVWLYAGAGIVGPSVAQKEWDETTLKFRPMLNALGIKDGLHERR